MVGTTGRAGTTTRTGDGWILDVRGAIAPPGGDLHGGHSRQPTAGAVGDHHDARGGGGRHTGAGFETQA